MKELKEFRTELADSSLKKYEKLQSLYEGKILSEENGYIAFFKNQKLEVYASTLFQAKEKALVEFKKKFPKVKDFHMLHVHLAEKDGEQVTHTADF